MLITLLIFLAFTLWQSTLGNSLPGSAHPEAPAGVSHFCSTVVSDESCIAPTTSPIASPDQPLRRVFEPRAETNRLQAISPMDSDPTLQCPLWNSLPWVPLQESTPGSWIPYTYNMSGFVLWCDIDLPFRPPINPNGADVELVELVEQIESVARCIRLCIGYNLDYKTNHCTAVTITPTSSCYLKHSWDGFMLNPNTTLRSVQAPGFVSALMIPANYTGNNTFQPPILYG